MRASLAMTAHRAPAGGGWIVFAAVFLFTLGIFNSIWGIAALADDARFRADELLFADLGVWGGVMLAIGVVQLVVAAGIFRGSEMAQVVGMLLAILNATVQLMSIGAYPLWSVVVLVLDGLVIYGLTVYGERWTTSGT
jgi:hypothetical protein